jgi:hypothetical protein
MIYEEVSGVVIGAAMEILRPGWGETSRVPWKAW